MTFTYNACGNVEINPSNIPLSSDTNHVTASDCNVNNRAANTCLEAVSHEISGDACKNSMQGSLHHAAFNGVAPGTSPRELIITDSRSLSKNRASVYACRDRPHSAASKK